MDINLNKINESGIIIDQIIDFTDDIYKSAIIKGLEDVYVKGKIYYSTTKEILFEGDVKGNMLIVDSHSANLIKYPFSCKINEVLEEDNDNLKVNKQNSLDLKEVLWQNIVLEVPTSFSESNEIEVTKGDGWELKSDDSDPRLNVFKDLLDKRKE